MANPYHIPSVYRQLLNPVKILVRLLDFLFSFLRSAPEALRKVKVVCISDTHTLIPDDVPDGDILIHAGDLTNAGTPNEIQAQIDWLCSLPHQYKIAIAGNHDTWLDPKSRETLSPSDQNGHVDWKDIHYLQDSSVLLDLTSTGRGRLRVFGGPHVPLVGGPEHAFQHPIEEDVWTGKIPPDVDIVVTHSPPKFHLDLPGVKAMGNPFLLREIRRTKPVLQVFGHIHAGKSDLLGLIKGGREVVWWDEGERCFAEIMNGASAEGLLGLIFGLLDLGAWFRLLAFVIYGSLAVAQDRVLGQRPASTFMVNAALMYCDTGKIRNRPQVVEI
ncbi:related to adult brain protein 239 [Ramularia collo-cygni]|uniref:Related to adult brain protein 239 n=1 Tax=Ramularia collo-cygni TaxID=112498 RepID=A0A2D3V6Z5_9PEZI|nr:related to adult brain protein 239 [Ramularia collo-cygni]CZT16113.1 related to adult brain protein 239 [Ramularia collo-cygni]